MAQEPRQTASDQIPHFNRNSGLAGEHRGGRRGVGVRRKCALERLAQERRGRPGAVQLHRKVGERDAPDQPGRGVLDGTGAQADQSLGAELRSKGQAPKKVVVGRRRFETWKFASVTNTAVLFFFS